MVRKAVITSYSIHYTKLYEESWQDWLMCDNDYARRDIGMMEAEGGNYFNLISIIATKL